MSNTFHDVMFDFFLFYDGVDLLDSQAKLCTSALTQFFVFGADDRGDVNAAVWQVWTPGKCENYVAQDRGGKSSQQELWLCCLHEEKGWRKSSKRIERLGNDGLEEHFIDLIVLFNS